MTNMYKLVKHASKEDKDALRDLYVGMEMTNRKLQDVVSEIENYPCLKEVLTKILAEYYCHHFIVANWWELFIEEEMEVTGD